VLYFALATLIEGIVYSFFTNWGFTKHRWILWKWLMTVVLVPCVGFGTISQTFATIERVKEQGFQGGFADGGSILFFI
jgi:dethiobiotin synthetase